MPHFRAKPTTLVKVSDIYVPPMRFTDDAFLRLVTQELQGKLDVALTRLPEASITTGFFEHKAGEVHHRSELDSNYVLTTRDSISSGARPIVEVYWSQLAPNKGGYVCPDSEVTLATYRLTSINYVPIRILKPKRAAGPEGAIIIRPTEDGFRHLQRPTHVGYDTFRIDGDIDATFELDLLISYCEDTLSEITSFHKEGDGKLHYHQFLHAIVRRHARAVSSISWLVVNKRFEHAFILLRSTYEAFLNFYVDWLSPELIGPRLQFISSVRARNSCASELKIIGNYANLLESSSQKALLTPLGSSFYENVYGFLSLAAHQSYSYTQREGSSFLEQEDEREVASTIAQHVNFITAALLKRVRNEVGRL